MGRRGIPGAARGDHRQAIVGAGRRAAAGAQGKREAKRVGGLAIIERDGHWHVVGTLRIKGRSIRVRTSTGLSAKGENKEAAQELRRQKEREIRDQVLWGRPSFRGGVGSD